MNYLPTDGPTALLGEQRGVPVVEVYGEIDLVCVDALDEVLDRAIRRCRGAGRYGGRSFRGAVARDVVVDLREARFMEVLGLGSLIRHHHALRSIGGELRLICREGQITWLLEVAEMFDVHRDLDEAVSVVRNEAPGKAANTVHSRRSGTCDG